MLFATCAPCGSKGASGAGSRCAERASLTGWVPLGPAPISGAADGDNLSGRVTSIAVVPSAERRRRATWRSAPARVSRSRRRAGYSGWVAPAGGHVDVPPTLGYIDETVDCG
jgi:hypothetical protein